MKHITNLSLPFLFTFGFASFGSTQLLTESFETDGEGVRYTSNFAQTSCSDFFTRIDNTPASYCLTSHPTNPNGSFYWGTEDTDAAVGGEGILTLNALAVTGNNLDVDVSLAVGRPNDFRLENADYFIIEYNMDGGGWNAFGALRGNNGTGSGNLQNDADFNGLPDGGGFEINSSDFINVNYTIPVTGTSVQVRVRMLANTGTEEIVMDNIRINGTSFLPVELANFEVEKLDEGVLLNWQTVSELNNDGFKVLHSEDGANWNSIDFVEGAGTAINLNYYQTLHRDAINGMNYYKLEQVDFDGTISYSDTRSVSFSEVEDLSISPNPNNGNFSVTVNPELFKNYVRLEVLDLNGASVHGDMINIEMNNTIQLNATHFVSGVYLIRISDDFSTRIERVVVD